MTTNAYGYCSHHPTEKIVSDCGMYEGVCGHCEGEMAAASEAWEADPENPYRLHCEPFAGVWPAAPWVAAARCDPPAEIPF